MPKFLIQATFSPDGVKNLLEQGGTKREEQLQGLARSLEGSLEAVYFSPQRNEGFVILDLPDGQRARALLVAAVLRDSGDHCRDAIARRGHGRHHRRAPVTAR